MRRLLLFNCSNDLALAQGTKEYIAPKSVVRMERDLCALPWWWAAEGDAVLLTEGTDKDLIENFYARYNKNILFINEEEGYETLHKKSGADFRPTPWGWSKATAARLQRFGVPASLMPDNKALDTMRALSSREFAAEYIKEFLSHKAAVPHHHILVGEKMRFIKRLEELIMPERTIFKSPWSSSGRGVFAADSIDEPSIREKLAGFISRQGGFLADKMYNKQQDFALEYFISDSGEVQFLGFSLFTAGGNGYYGYNFVASQNELRAKITKAGLSDTLIEKLIEIHSALLSQSLSGKYCGIVGIDMLTAIDDDTLKIHPCIEINLRMNIGVLAMKVFERTGGIDTQLIPTHNNIFCAEVKEKKLLIIPRQ